MLTDKEVRRLAKEASKEKAFHVQKGISVKSGKIKRGRKVSTGQENLIRTSPGRGVQFSSASTILFYGGTHVR